MNEPSIPYVKICEWNHFTSSPFIGSRNFDITNIIKIQALMALSGCSYHPKGSGFIRLFSISEAKRQISIQLSTEEYL
jgi:hypothetical protein